MTTELDKIRDAVIEAIDRIRLTVMEYNGKRQEIKTRLVNQRGHEMTFVAKINGKEIVARVEFEVKE